MLGTILKIALQSQDSIALIFTSLIACQVFVGFGFLMTFLRRYCLSAVALNMAASAIVYVEAILVIGAMQQVAFGGGASSIVVDMPLLINAAFCAASCMIAFGAVIGKTTPGQLVMLLVAQVPIYAANQHLAVVTFKALDMGGTIVIHLFGAYYGLAASYMLSRNQGVYGVDHPKNVSGYLNDAIAMVGTLFLWIYWPSFNGALASVSLTDTLSSVTDAQASSQFLSIVNTLLSLLGSTIATFAASAITGKGRLNMMHVQNSAIAGGVAMGSACTLHMTPGGSLVVGTAAGVLSVCGYTYVTPYLDRLIGLGDTCGIHNLHGMPAILGGLAAGLAALGQGSDYLSYSSGSLQLGYQVAAMACTVAIALSGKMDMQGSTRR
jgi:ammonium transporter Rh